MNPQGQNASFIPQRPMQAPKKRGTRKVYVLTYISYVLFFATVFAAVGVFLYERYLDTRLEIAKNRLIEEEGKFDQSQIASIKQLDEQIKLAQGRMQEHLSLIPIFSELEHTVAKSLSLSSFSYAREADAAPKIEIVGEAEIVGNLLFQRDIFSQSPLLVGAVFSDVSLNSSAEQDKKTGSLDPTKIDTTIAFQLGKQLSKELLSYAAVPVAEETVPETETTFSEEDSIATEEDEDIPEDASFTNEEPLTESN